MKLLAIDTSAEQCAACVFDTTAGAAHAVSREMTRGHAEALMEVIAECLGESGVSYADLGRIAVTVGPGSFTGVRVGVATARGLALALGIPLVGVSTLEALAAAARADRPDRPILAVNDARRGEVYAAAYDERGGELVAPRVTTLSEAATAITAQTVLAGSASGDLVAHGAEPFAVSLTAAAPPVRFVAVVAAEKPVTRKKPKPLYLRAPDAKPQAGFALPRKAG